MMDDQSVSSLFPLTIPANDLQSAIYIPLRRATTGGSPLVRIPSKWARGPQQKEAAGLEWVVFDILNLRIGHEADDMIDWLDG